MAKYSTGESTGGDGGDACELCGEPSDSLREANIAGAELLVCERCAPHDDGPAADESAAAENADAADEADAADDGGSPTATGSSPLWDSDTSHWEQEGTGYESDPLPYLAPDYGQRVTRARQDAGLQREELADELGVTEEDLLAVEQGRAARAGIGGSVIFALEERLDVAIAEDRM